MPPRLGRLDLATALGILGLTALLCWGAWYQLFSNFAVWDDEGACAVALDLFLYSGKVLYEDYLNQYGPAYFFFFATILKFSQQVPSADSLRLLSLVLWAISGVSFALIIYRLTRERAQSLLGLVLVFHVTSSMTNEPGHPQWLVLAVLSLLLGVMILPGRPWYGFAGLLSAFLIWVKINVGAFVFAAVVWHWLAESRITSKIWAKTFAMALAFAATVLLRDRLTDGAFVILLVLVLLTLATLATRDTRRQGAESRVTLTRYFSGVVVGSGLLLVATLFLGVSFQKLWFAMVGQHLGFGAKFWIAPTWSLVSFLGAATSLAMFFFREKLSPGLLGSLATITYISALAYLGASLLEWSSVAAFLFQTLPWSLSLGWLAPEHQEEPDEGQREGFSLLAKVGCLMLLYAYPVAGSQLGLSAVVGAVLALSVPGQRRKLSGLVLIFAVLACFRQTYAGWRQYQHLSSPVAFSTNLRLPEWRWLQMEWLVWNLRLNGYPVISFLGTYSVVNWSGRETAVPWIQSTWTEGLALNELEKLLQSTEGYPELAGMTGLSLLQAPRPQDTLQRALVKSFLRERFQSVSEFGGTVVLAARRNSSPWLLVGAWRLEDGSLRVVAPCRSDQVGRLELLSWRSGFTVEFQTLAESVEVAPDLTEWTLRPSEWSEGLFVRIWSHQGQLLARLPLCSPPPVDPRPGRGAGTP